MKVNCQNFLIIFIFVFSNIICAQSTEIEGNVIKVNFSDNSIKEENVVATWHENSS